MSLKFLLQNLFQIHFFRFIIPILFLISANTLSAQMDDSKGSTMYFLNSGIFFSPPETDMYFSPALDAEIGFWKTNSKNYFSWGASTEVWYFTSVAFEQGKNVAGKNTDGFINLNGMFFLDNKILTPVLAPSVSFATDFKNAGASASIMLGINHKTAKRVNTFLQFKYIKFTNNLSYLDMCFFMTGLSLNLSE